MKNTRNSAPDLTAKDNDEACVAPKNENTNNILTEYVVRLTFCCLQLVDSLCTFIKRDLSETVFSAKTSVDYESLLDDIFKSAIDCKSIRSFGKQVSMSDITTRIVYSLKMDITLRIYGHYYSDSIMNPIRKETLNSDNSYEEVNKPDLVRIKNELRNAELYNKEAWTLFVSWTNEYLLSEDITPFIYFLATLRSKSDNRVICESGIFTKRLMPKNLSLEKYTKYSESLLNIIKAVNRKENNQYKLVLNMFLLNFFSDHYENTVAYSQHHFMHKCQKDSDTYRAYMPQSVIDHDILPKELFFAQFYLLQLFSDWKSCEVVQLIENLGYSEDLPHTISFTNSMLKIFNDMSSYCDCVVSLLSQKIYKSNSDVISMLSGNKYLSKKNIKEYFPFSLYQKGLNEKKRQSLDKRELRRKDDYITLRKEIIRKLEEPPSWPLDAKFIESLNDVVKQLSNK